MNKKAVFEKIEDVMQIAGRKLAPHEFKDTYLAMPSDSTSGGRIVDGLFYVGCSESALGRRLREMRELGRVVSAYREGSDFKEYGLPVRAPEQQHFSFLKV